ncbi:hypothetical protein [Algihabitans sp.]|uniref:hypothetical protein n=1 Tax=Algihabitans sp. TaxID=2821514 RepID=UPI003BABD5CA
MSKRVWVGGGAAALVVALAGGGYALLLASANDAVERSFAQFRASLPAGAVFSHGPYEIDLLERSVSVASPSIDFNGYGRLGRLSAERAHVLGLEPGETETRAAEVLFDGVEMTDPGGVLSSVTLQQVVARDVAISGQPADLREGLLATRVGQLTASEVGLSRDDVVVSLQQLTLADLDGGRLGTAELDDLRFESRGADEHARFAFGSLSLAGLDLTAMLEQAEPLASGDWRSAVRLADLEQLRAAAVDLAVDHQQVTLEELVIEEVDDAKLGRIRLVDLAVDNDGPASGWDLTAGLLSLEGFEISPLFSLSPRQLAASSDEEIFERTDAVAQQIAANLMGYAVEEIRFETDRFPGAVELAGFRLTDPQIIDGRVVGGLTEIERFSFPFDPAMSVFANRIWSELELEDRLAISLRGDQRYDPATSSLSTWQDVTLHDMLELRLSGRLGSLAGPLHAGMSQLDLQVALLGATLGEAEVIVTDLGLLRPALEVMAEGQGVTAEQLVGQWIVIGAEAARTFQLGPVALEALEAIEVFLLEAGRLQVALAPVEEVPLLLLGAAGSPAAALDLVNPSISVLAE